MPKGVRKGVTPERRALNQHLHRHHDGLRLGGTFLERATAHDELHWQAKREGVNLGHEHAPYQDGETDLEMAQRYLADGEASNASE
jgi:hypothetical protein